MHRLKTLFASALLFAAAQLPAAVVTETVEYMDGETTLEGFLAYDDSVTGRRPAVLIIHQWKGIQDHEREVAERLAAMGYVAFAADIYGQGIRPETDAEAAAQATIYRSGDRADFRRRIDVAVDFLEAHERVNPRQIAAIGYCFGGTGVLELARSGRRVAGVVSFHGSLAPGDAPTELMNTRVLVLHGNDDPLVPPEEVVALAEELRDAGADYYIIGFGNAVHSFTDRSADGDVARFDETADRRSWIAMNNFLDEIFGLRR